MQSRVILGEAKLAYVHVKQLLEGGISQKDIAVISPYNLQVCILVCTVTIVYITVVFIVAFFTRSLDNCIFYMVKLFYFIAAFFASSLSALSTEKIIYIAAF